MRKVVIGLAALVLLGAACAEDTATQPGDTGEPTGSETSSAAPATAAECAAQQSFTVEERLTVGTDNPAYPPYFSGGETDAHADWKGNDPYTGEGLEAAVAYEVASRMGFSEDQVDWVVAPFNQTYKPGPKDYDFAIEQIAYSPKRDDAVDFSSSYYDVNQAIVVQKGTPISKVTDTEGLKDFALAAPIGSTNYDLIVDTIQPNTEPGAYNTLNDTVAALNAQQVDGIVVDLPTALYIADPFVQQAENSTVLAQYATAEQGEYFGMAFADGSPLVTCVNLALEEMTADGTLEEIQTTWLSEQTNVGEVPLFAP